MKKPQEIQKELIELAISWGEAFTTGDYRTANTKNSAIAKVNKKLRLDKNLGEIILTPLLSHPSPSVRLMASVYNLEFGIHIQEAEAVLTSIAADPELRLIPVMAKINLSQWNEKKSAKLTQKDEPAG